MTENYESFLYKSEISLKNLINPGAFLFQGRIYLVGGQLYKDDFFSITDKIFSFSAYNDKNFGFREESFKLPFKLMSPVCASGSAHAFVTGGILENNEYNKQMIVIKLENNEVKICEAELNGNIEEDYPPAYLEDNIILFSFPKLWVKPKNADVLSGFSFSKKPSTNSANFHEVSVTKGDKSKPPVIKTADLSFSFINEEKPDCNDEPKSIDNEENDGNERKFENIKENPNFAQQNIRLHDESKTIDNLLDLDESKSSYSQRKETKLKKNNIKHPKILIKSKENDSSSVSENNIITTPESIFLPIKAPESVRKPEYSESNSSESSSYERKQKILDKRKNKPKIKAPIITKSSIKKNSSPLLKEASESVSKNSTERDFEKQKSKEKVQIQAKKQEDSKVSKYNNSSPDSSFS